MTTRSRSSGDRATISTTRGRAGPATCPCVSVVRRPSNLFHQTTRAGVQQFESRSSGDRATASTIWHRSTATAAAIRLSRSSGDRATSSTRRARAVIALRSRSSLGRPATEQPLPRPQLTSVDSGRCCLDRQATEQPLPQGGHPIFRTSCRWSRSSGDRAVSSTSSRPAFVKHVYLPVVSVVRRPSNLFHSRPSSRHRVSIVRRPSNLFHALPRWPRCHWCLDRQATEQPLPPATSLSARSALSTCLDRQATEQPLPHISGLDGRYTLTMSRSSGDRATSSTSRSNTTASARTCLDRQATEQPLPPLPARLSRALTGASRSSGDRATSPTGQPRAAGDPVADRNVSIVRRPSNLFHEVRAFHPGLVDFQSRSSGDRATSSTSGADESSLKHLVVSIVRRPSNLFHVILITRLRELELVSIVRRPSNLFHVAHDRLVRRSFMSRSSGDRATSSTRDRLGRRPGFGSAVSIVR